VRRLLLSTALAGLAVVGLAGPAFAHDVLTDSTPADGASVAVGPSEVTLTFNAPVQFGANRLTVTGPDGQQWQRTDNATVNGDTVSTPVAPLGPAGEYTVGYRVISADGHPVSGEVTFTLTKAGPGTPPTQATAGNSPSTASAPAGPPAWPWVLGAVILLALGLFLGLRTPRMGALRR
jgi:methionine-rich copper-binding protein CopC